MYVLHDSVARGISRSDELANVLKMRRKFHNKHQRNCVDRRDIGDYGKGEFGNKKHEHTFLELVQELDK